MRPIWCCAIAVATTLGGSTALWGHHPERECQPVTRRIDVIGPLGNCLPMSYRRRYNRPTNIGGKIAYHIAPSSQEAMAWHKATHQGAYENKRPRLESHYFYPKPYEALRIGPRRETETDEKDDADRQTNDSSDVTSEGPDIAPLDGPLDNAGQTVTEPEVDVDDSVNDLLRGILGEQMLENSGAVSPPAVEIPADVLDKGFESPK